MKRKVGSFFGLVVAGIAVVGATAFACTNLATLNLSSASGNAGETLTATGSSFRVAKEGPSVPVVLHWNGADGAVLAESVPDSAGNISATFQVPEGDAGYYVIVATQRDAEGEDQYGTPARASYQILGAGGEAAAQQPATESPLVASEPGSDAGIIALTIGLGVLGLALFGAGFTAFARQARRRDVPEAAKVRSDD
ncbi:MAG: hypothetical protein ACRDZ9_09925 [Acidimicrobiales bacterium]